MAVDEHSTMGEVDRRKRRAAAVAALPRVFDLVVANDPGRTQDRIGSYYSGKDFVAMTRVSRPDLLSAAELLRRIRSFGRIDIEIDGTVWPVTRMRTGRPGRPLRSRRLTACG